MKTNKDLARWQAKINTHGPKKYILESLNPHGDGTWGWTGLTSDSLDDILERGKEFAAKHRRANYRTLAQFRVVESRAKRNAARVDEVAFGEKIWEI